MRVWSAEQLLDVWERGLAESPVRRALILLESASPEAPREALAGLSIGQRDARLLSLRESVFGPQLASTALCPGCGERLEMTLNIDDLRVEQRGESPEIFEISVADHALRCRLANSIDLAAVEDQAELAAARESLLERCVLSAEKHGVGVPVAHLPDAVMASVIDRMAKADPQAVIELHLACPHCHWRWPALFDIAAYLWTELNACAQRLLREVHALASAYGWSEADIVAMSPARRRIYLDMVNP